MPGFVLKPQPAYLTFLSVQGLPQPQRQDGLALRNLAVCSELLTNADCFYAVRPSMPMCFAGSCVSSAEILFTSAPIIETAGLDSEAMNFCRNNKEAEPLCRKVRNLLRKVRPRIEAH